MGNNQIEAVIHLKCKTITVLTARIDVESVSFGKIFLEFNFIDTYKFILLYHKQKEPSLNFVFLRGIYELINYLKSKL